MNNAPAPIPPDVRKEFKGQIGIATLSVGQRGSKEKKHSFIQVGAYAS